MRAIEREVLITRVAVRDFDHGDQVWVAKQQCNTTCDAVSAASLHSVYRHHDRPKNATIQSSTTLVCQCQHSSTNLRLQALMLPEAVRMLHLLLSMGKRVYVHCTAGINRATLTVVGYLTFVKVSFNFASAVWPTLVFHETASSIECCLFSRACGGDVM